MSPPPSHSKEKLREMSHEVLVEYAHDRQEAAYIEWEKSMGRDL